VLVDGNGLPIRILLSPGQASDKAAVPELIAGIQPGRDLVADRGYDARAILQQVEAAGGRAHIPTCRDRNVQRSVDPELYRHRNLVALLQQAQTLPPHRHPLRQDGAQLPRRRPHRSNPAVGAL
jgi:transposase